MPEDSLAITVNWRVMVGCEDLQGTRSAAAPPQSMWIWLLRSYSLNATDDGVDERSRSADSGKQSMPVIQ
ncbi:hypothetical protein VP1G_11348 [Cytospora mali]|uniref:Uncharacterized protein n=1 Tax=Cytospora mali TaxID=578113 RepID=A0A194VDN1_CYTMA|nr:hypothetical protein VP1G_11348 [Valsa mali var. pyri (nom. inval.)]